MGSKSKKHRSQLAKQRKSGTASVASTAPTALEPTVQTPAEMNANVNSRHVNSHRNEQPGERVNNSGREQPEGTAGLITGVQSNDNPLKFSESHFATPGSRQASPPPDLGTENQIRELMVRVEMLRAKRNENLHLQQEHFRLPDTATFHPRFPDQAARQGSSAIIARPSGIQISRTGDRSNGGSGMHVRAMGPGKLRGMA